MRKRILLMASYSEHWVQMRNPASVFEELDQHYVSTNASLAQSVLPASFTVVTDANLIQDRVGFARED